MTVVASSAQQPMALEVSGVSHAFGKRLALDNVSFAIPAARFCLLLGLNGAGKTTLFSLITRLYDNTSGSIRALGYEVRRQSMPALRGLGVVFQQRTLDLDLSVSQNLTYHAALHGYSRRMARERTEAELARVGLTDRAHDKVRELSGGQMRKVEIARALLHRPRLLLLDEPTVGLDINARQDIIDRVRGLCRDERLTVLWATHLIDEVGPGDRMVILHCGKVLADDSVENVKAGCGTASIRDAFSKLTKEADSAKTERAA